MNGITMWRLDPAKAPLNSAKARSEACTNRAKRGAQTQGKQWRSKGRNRIEVSTASAGAKGAANAVLCGDLDMRKSLTRRYVVLFGDAVAAHDVSLPNSVHCP